MADELKKDVTEEQIKQWKAQHGDVFVLESDDLTVYCRRPRRDEMARFAKELQRDLYRASHNLLVSCRLHPDMQVISQMAEAKPGVILSLAGELSELAGANISFLSRKL